MGKLEIYQNVRNSTPTHKVEGCQKKLQTAGCFVSTAAISRRVKRSLRNGVTIDMQNHD